VTPERGNVKQKKLKSSPSVGSHKPTRLDRLRTIENLLALETMGQESVRRNVPAQPVPPNVRIERQLNRLPVIGLRSQRTKIVHRNVNYEDLYSDVRSIAGPIKNPKGRPSLCHRRHMRKSVLFAMKVAGKGLRRSPGQGGSYRRTSESLVRC